jgi:hypothetical protein
MDERTLYLELHKARSRREVGQLRNYWMGYECGLMRGFYGTCYVADEEHEAWLTFAGASELWLRERGRGYRDGLVMATAEEAA